MPTKRRKKCTGFPYCTRIDPLPLLPSGPGGVGGNTSRRTRHIMKFSMCRGMDSARMVGSNWGISRPPTGGIPPVAAWLAGPNLGRFSRRIRVREYASGRRVGGYAGRLPRCYGEKPHPGRGPHGTEPHRSSYRENAHGGGTLGFHRHGTTFQTTANISPAINGRD